MKTQKSLLMMLLGCAALVGCATHRSISHSNYKAPAASFGNPVHDIGSDPAFEYRGELSEFDVLGISRSEFASEADIRKALESSKSVKVQPGSSILLIQSGALFPDGAMVKEMSKQYRVVPFSGMPTLRKDASRLPTQTESADPENFARSLRLTAAHGGTDYIVCYWGALESASDRLPTKTISWIPIARWFLIDEKQHMRIQLKVALIDVRTGNWTIFSPKSLTDSRLSTSPRRETNDQKQVEHLKNLAYEAAVSELAQNFN